MKGSPGYPPEVVEHMKKRVLEEIEKGKSLRRVLREDDDLEFPSAPYIFQWLNPDHKNFDTDFAEQYSWACSVREDKLFEETLEIADDSSHDTIYREDGSEMINSEWVQRSKIRISTRQWMLGKMRPKKYGDRLTNVHEGGDKPVEVIDYTKLSEAALEELAKQANAGQAKSE